MQGFLLRMIQHQLRRLALVATLGMVIITTTAVISGELEDPAIDEAGLAVGKARLGTGDGCESSAVKPAAARQGVARERSGTALSCAAGEVDLGSGSRSGGKSADRVSPKQRN